VSLWIEHLSVTHDAGQFPTMVVDFAASDKETLLTTYHFLVTVKELNSDSALALSQTLFELEQKQKANSHAP